MKQIKVEKQFMTFIDICHNFFMRRFQINDTNYAIIKGA